MTARRAFMRRDYFTCRECFYYRVGDDGHPSCERHGDIIHYDPHRFGCGEFGTRDDRERETVYTFGVRS